MPSWTRGATRLGFYTRAAMDRTLGFELRKPATDAAGFELGFKVADVDAAYAELTEKGAAAATRPTTRPWGQRTAYVRDPDGHLIELAQDLKQASEAGSEAESQGLGLRPVLLLDEVVDLVRGSAHHKQRVRVQRLIHAVGSTDRVGVAEAVQKVAVAL